MADILLVDSNPEHVRSLEGIVKYRTRHAIDVVPDCVQALRRIHDKHPDLILINVLLYGSVEFGFAQALSESPVHATIPIAVHASGHIGDLTRRRIEAQGARLLELPISADELEEELHRPAKVSGIETVTWGQAAPQKRSDKAAKTQENSGVRSLNWSVDGTASKKVPETSPVFESARPTTPPKKSAKREPAPVPQKLPSRNASTGFSPLASSVERVEGPAEAPVEFSPESEWKQVDPESVKNRHRSTKRS